jgi:branched-chain amino acid transport system permease protein
MTGQIVVALLNGLSSALAVFLVAAGLTLIFGILKILNFSHGGFFMIGAYVAFALLRLAGTESLATFLGAAVAAGFAVAILGVIVERVVLRRLRGVDEAYMLIATFAVMLLCEGAVKLIWGVNFVTIDPPEALAGAVELGPLFLPSFSLFVIAAGVVAFLALETTIHRTRLGKLVQAVANDPWMAGLLGINVPLVFTATVVVAFFLAGLAGGLLLPNQTLSPGLASLFIIQAFVAIIVGGVGNVRGAFIAALLLGIVDSFGTIYLPQIPGIAVYVAMCAFLLFRPEGLLGSARA